MIKSFVKKIIKFSSSSLGYEINRKGMLRKTLSDVLENVVSLDFEPKTVIDVGVAYGTFELYDNFPNAKHLLIEPLREFEEVVRDICVKHNADYIIATAGPRKSKIIMNIHSVLTGSSIYRESEGSHVDGIPREVPIVTIDDLCRGKGLMDHISSKLTSKVLSLMF